MAVPDVSVVIATRDRRRFLARAVASARAQRGVTGEIIVVDDGSTDDTRDWLSSVAGPELRVIPFGLSQGVSAARNAGIAASNGAWVAFLDDDDFWAPTYLQRQLENGRRTEASVLAGSALVVDRSLNPLRVLWAPTEPRQLVRTLFQHNVLGGPSRVIVRTEALQNGAGFDPRLAVMADWDLWISLIRHHRLAVTMELLVALTEHQHNMQIDRVDDIRGEIAYMRNKHADYAAATGAAFGGAGLDRWLAGRLRRAGRRRAAAQAYLRIARAHRTPVDFLRGAAAAAGAWHRGARRRRRVTPQFSHDWLAAHAPVADERER